VPVDPAVQAVLENMQAQAEGRPTIAEMQPAEARQMYSMMAAMSAPAPEVADVADRAVPSPAGDISVRVFTPRGQAPFPLVVFFHGGGWVLGDLDSHDSFCRHLAHQAGAVLVAVDYRLAP